MKSKKKPPYALASGPEEARETARKLAPCIRASLSLPPLPVAAPVLLARTHLQRLHNAIAGLLRRAHLIELTQRKP